MITPPQVERGRMEEKGVMGNGVIGRAGSLTVKACGAQFVVTQQEHRGAMSL